MREQDVKLECQQCRIEYQDLRRYWDPALSESEKEVIASLRAEAKREAMASVLLLQVDSDDEAGMMWGDVGRLYFCIQPESLAAEDFDSVWMTLQCT